MKKKEIVLWSLVAIALAANIWLPKHMHQKYSWEKDLSQRLADDFCKTREDVKEYIQQYIPDVTDEQIDAWTASGQLENMKIGKTTMYFSHAAPNLFRIIPSLDSIKAVADGRTGELSGHQLIDSKVIPAIEEQVLSQLASGAENPNIAEPKRMRVKFTLTVPAYTVKAGAILRCWLPFPRKDIARQTNVELIEAGLDSIPLPSERITFSDPSCAHSSIYMEAKAIKGKPTVFYEVFEYTSAGEWHPVDTAKVLPYNTEDPQYKENTAEMSKHIIFTPEIKALADSLTDGIDNPYLQALAIYKWVDKTPWASAREYSTIENIPEYVLKNGHGDCGQQTLLFMTMCRYKGIPTKWQSGLMMHPGNTSLHDWCEAYFEGYGWMPVDQSFGETSFGGLFYFGGIEPYRMIANYGLQDDLSPAKKYPRSDTVDFQRGEVEWDGGNLFYNQWDYDFEVEYL